MQSKKITLTGLLGATSIALGAMGAHFLKSKLSTGLITQEQLNAFDTAAKYQMYHTLAMFLLVILSEKKPHRIINFAYNSFLIGILLFSGSLYLLSMRHLIGLEWLRILGPVTPIGGLFLIIGWLFIAYIGIKKQNK